MQINWLLIEAVRRISTKYLVVVAALAAMLIAATALATDSAFADKKRKSHEKNQAVTQVNDCGNGERQNGDMVDTTPAPEPGAINVFCQNLASQIQGDYNTPTLAGEQPNPHGRPGGS